MAATREIPAGKVLLCDAPPLDELVRLDVFETREGEYGKVYRLIQVSPGWEIAGSTCRWTNGYFAARITERSGTIGGRQFKTLEEARAMFDLWTGEVA